MFAANHDFLGAVGVGGVRLLRADDMDTKLAASDAQSGARCFHWRMLTNTRYGGWLLASEKLADQYLSIGLIFSDLECDNKFELFSLFGILLLDTLFA